MRGPVAFLVRAFAGILGVCAACLALVTPFLFLANTLQESEWAKQYGGHAALLGAIVGITLVLFVPGWFGVAAYFLLRFSFRGRKAIAVDLGLPDKG